MNNNSYNLYTCLFLNHLINLEGIPNNIVRLGDKRTGGQHRLYQSDLQELLLPTDHHGKEPPSNISY